MLRKFLFVLFFLFKSILTQHSRNCLASIGDVKFKPHVSFVIGSFQYTKHSDAWPMRVPTKLIKLDTIRFKIQT